MKKRLFWMFSVLAVAVTLLTSVSVSLLYFRFYQAGVKEEIRTEGRMMLRGVEQAEDRALALAGYQSTLADTRVSLVRADGEVVYDSGSDAAQLDNHINREEIEEARQTGEGEATRFSRTFGENAYYYALRFSDGSVLRLSRQINHMTSVFGSMLRLAGILSLFFMGASIGLASLFTKRMLAPIEQAGAAIRNVLREDDETFNVDTYEELDYFVRTIKTLKGEIRASFDRLRAEKQTFETVTKHMQEGFLLLDGDSHILSINRSARRMLGTREERDYGGENLLFVSREPKLQSAVQRAFSEGTPIVFSQKSEAGDDHRFLVSPVQDEEHKTVGMMIFVTDITKEMKAERVRRDFAANVSHELKTPLTSIQGFSELMEQGMVEKQEDVMRFAGRIHREACRLMGLVEDILRLSEIESDAVPVLAESVDLSAVAREAAETILPAAQSKGVTVHCAGETEPILGNRAMLYELCYNLLDNAVNYNQAGGTAELRLEQEGANARLTVSDSGIGIPEEHLGRIFERFYRVDKSRSKQTGGTGLGLSIVKHVVEWHHGTIRVESEIGKGTTFTVLLSTEKGCPSAQ